MEAQRHIESAQEEALSLDLRRTLVLGRYLQVDAGVPDRDDGATGPARMKSTFSRRPPAAARPSRPWGYPAFATGAERFTPNG